MRFGSGASPTGGRTRHRGNVEIAGSGAARGGRAVQVAKVTGVTTVALTGDSGGKLKELCDILVNVPETESFKVQELHLPYYHALCLAVEEEFFGGRT